MKSIALRCLDGQHDGGLRWPLLRRTAPLVPVFVRLRQLAESEKSLPDFLAEHFEKRHFPRAARLIQKLDAAGRLVFLLDGLDEVEDRQRPALFETVRELFRVQRQSKPGEAAFSPGS